MVGHDGPGMWGLHPGVLLMWSRMTEEEETGVWQQAEPTSLIWKEL